MKFELKLSEDLSGEALEILEDQIAEWLRLKDFHGSVKSIDTESIVQIEDSGRAFQMRFEDLLGVEVRYPASFWEARNKMPSGEK